MKNNNQWHNGKSNAAFERARRCIPGGVNSPARAFNALPIGPPFVESAKGSKIYDIDGNEYIDYVCSWGPMILGHAHPAVKEAVIKAAEKGTSYGAPTEAETELAEKITNAFHSIQKVRLVSSGTEAVMSAIRLARAYTDRQLIVKMAGCYHGHSDSLLVQAGSGLAQTSNPSSAGVPTSIAEKTIVLPFNDTEAVKAAFAAHSDEIAGVLVEPVAANMGVIPPEPNYLETIHNLCTNHGSLLIFDEVITGFRLALGGAQEYYGIDADLTCLGKIIGGGLPAAAFGGRADVMDMLAPDGPVYQAGTLSGNPIATAAANATLDILIAEKPYKVLEEMSRRLQAGLTEAAADADLPMTINSAGSLFSCFFTDKPVRNFSDAQAADIEMFKKYFVKMLQSGIYLAPSIFEAIFLSTGHSGEDIDQTIQTARNVMKDL